VTVRLRLHILFLKGAIRLPSKKVLNKNSNFRSQLRFDKTIAIILSNAFL
jgi:hypothetical protein